MLNATAISKKQSKLISLAETLQYYLRLKGFSESEIAKKTSIPYNTIRRIVDGVTTDPHLSTLLEIAKALEVSLDELVSSTALHYSSVHNKPYTVPLFTWTDLSTINPIETISLKNWPNWYTIPPVSYSDNKQHGLLYALKTTPSMQPRFPIGTVLIIDSNMEPIDGDLVLIKIKSNNSVTLRDIIIDPPSTNLLPISQNSTSLAYDEAVHSIMGVVVLNLLARR